MEDKKQSIDLVKISKILYSKKRFFLILWGIVFVLSVLWVIPKPRYYKCDVSLAPEASGDAAGGGLASIASNFGFDLSSGGADAIYPSLYPTLMESNEFVVRLLAIQVTTADKSVSTDYYTYLKKYQQKNWLTQPFANAFKAVAGWFGEKQADSKPLTVYELNPAKLSEKDYNLVESVKGKISCSVDKKTDVITISVEDQDPEVCAALADSVRQHLQDFIIDYRTKKARVDVEHYRVLADSTRIDYDVAVDRYSAYCDANRNAFTQATISMRDKLKEELNLKLNAYSAMKTQYESMKAKLQERTPAFTTLKCATVPIKPAGPKRMLFVLGMELLASIIAAGFFARKEIFVQA